jgi:hypothetical protein
MTHYLHQSRTCFGASRGLCGSRVAEKPLLHSGPFCDAPIDLDTSHFYEARRPLIVAQCVIAVCVCVCVCAWDSLDAGCGAPQAGVVVCRVCSGPRAQARRDIQEMLWEGERAASGGERGHCFLPTCRNEISDWDLFQSIRGVSWEAFPLKFMQCVPYVCGCECGFADVSCGRAQVYCGVPWRPRRCRCLRCAVVGAQAFCWRIA